MVHNCGSKYEYDYSTVHVATSTTGTSTPVLELVQYCVLVQ